MYRVGVGEQTGCGCIECLCIDCMWLYKGVYMYRVDDGVQTGRGCIEQVFVYRLDVVL